jgi:hypothetical protein
VASNSAIVSIASMMTAAFVLAGCASQPTSVAGDDEALCRYSGQAGDAQGLSRCRDRLDRQHRRAVAANAIRIDGYALLNTPEPSTGMAGRCKGPDAPKDCDAGDVTGTIPAKPAR